ncbi:phage tail tape measure protein, TP901 family, core region [Pisciglobus halotolerans]|uniref:Phage tail tape measure protein, TP901 family, core region n=1 Tax=Pisciglobus halotolerans TaxID=745365 RepID=A0A1I3C2N2_9LACT|nr:phage tail tape measure protein, TP901 family, core region [Pisciglobus halotolerans]
MAKEIPASTTEISAVAEAAGQLGIKTENVLEFTRTMIDMGESTNLSSEEAASSLAQLANITKMPQESFDNLGSAIVELGNNMATTEADIVNMSLRLAGSAKQAGMSEDQILALAAAMSSVGINAEAGGGSMSRVMQKINSDVLSGGGNLKKFAKISGMSSSEFQKAWKDDAASAITEFVKGLGRVKESGGDVSGALKDMGINSTQEIDTLLRLSGAGDLLSEALDTSADAWKENTALTEEAQKRYETFQSKLEIVKNKLKDIGIEVGGPLMDALGSALDALQPVIDVVTDLAKAFSEASPAVQNTVMIIAGIVAAAGPVLFIVGSLIQTLAALIPIVKAVAGIFGIATGAVGWIAVVIPIVIAAVVALTIAIVKNWDEIKQFLSETWNTIKETAVNVWNSLKEFFSELWSSITEGATNAWNSLSEFFSNLWNTISQTTSDMWTTFTTFLTETWSSIVESASNIWNGLVEFLSGIWDSISNTTIEAWNSLVEFMKPIIDGLINVIMVPISLVQTGLEAIWILIKDGAIIAWEAIKIVASTAWNAIKEHIVNPIKEAWANVSAKLQEMWSGVVQKFDAIKSAASEKWNAVKNAIATAFTSAKNTVVKIASNIWSSVTSKFEQVRSAAAQKWNAVKTAVTSPFKAAKNAVVTTASNMWSSVTSKFESIRSSASSKFNAAKNAIIDPIKAAKDKISEYIDKIKGFFSNLKLKIPKPSMPKMPHFSLKTSSKTVLGKTITYPTGIGVTWNAKGGIFNRPTIIGEYGGKLQGVGEAGKEAVLPLNEKNLGGIGKGIANAMFGGNDLRDMLDNLVNNFGNQNISIVFNPVVQSPADMDMMFDKADHWLANKGISKDFGIGKRR